MFSLPSPSPQALYHRLLAYGATLSDSLHGAVTHVVVMPDGARSRGGDIKVGSLSGVSSSSTLLALLCLQDRIRLLRTLDAHSYEKRIVTPKWVENSIERGYVDEPRGDEEVVVL